MLKYFEVISNEFGKSSIRFIGYTMHQYNFQPYHLLDHMDQFNIISAVTRLQFVKIGQKRQRRPLTSDIMIKFVFRNYCSVIFNDSSSRIDLDA